MGFLNIFKNKEVYVEKSENQLEIPEIQIWFEKKFSDRIDKAEAEIKKSNKQILQSLPEIKTSIQKLQKPKVEEKYREDAIINSLKDSYVKRALSIFNKFPTDISADFDERVKSTLNELNNPNSKEIYVVTTYFQKESKHLIDSIKQTQDLLNKLNNFISEDGKIIFIKREIDNSIKNYKEKIEQNKDLEITTLNRENKVQEGTNKISKLKTDIEYLKKSDKAKRETELNWGIEIFQNQISELESLIKEQLSILKRPVEKLQHEIELNKDEEKSIERFSKSSFNFFIENQNEVSIFLDLVKKNSHMLKLKETEKEKIKQIEFSKLDELRKEYLEKIKQKEEAEKKLAESDLKAEVEELGLESEKTVKEIEEYLKEIQNNKNQIASNKNEIRKIEEELKKTIFENLNVEIKLKESETGN